MKKTTEQFIERAKEVHGEKYDYSLVDYVNNETKIKIICPIHGIFEQTPNHHLRGSNCPYCSRKSSANKHKLTSLKFVERAKEVHGEKYDYSLVDYKDRFTKVKIICPKHGIFEQTPVAHLNGYGCSKCANKSLTKKEFIERAKEVHGIKYDYSLVEFTDAHTKVKIICPKHGIFEQTPATHLKSIYGCRVCSENNRHANKKISNYEFVERAKEVHGEKYDYSLVDYKNSREKVKIICPKHGVFETKPFNFLNKHGCPKCNSSIGENEIKKILKENNILFEEQKKFADCKDRLQLPFDFFIPSKNLLIEYNGVQHYKPIEIFGGQKQLRLQRHHDWLKRKFARDNNFAFLTISYKDDIENKLIENGVFK